MKERVRFNWSRGKWDPTMAELEAELGFSDKTKTIRDWIKAADPDMEPTPAPEPQPTITPDVMYGYATGSTLQRLALDQANQAQSLYAQQYAENMALMQQMNARAYSSGYVPDTLSALFGSALGSYKR